MASSFPSGGGGTFASHAMLMKTLMPFGMVKVPGTGAGPPVSTEDACDRDSSCPDTLHTVVCCAVDLMQNPAAGARFTRTLAVEASVAIALAVCEGESAWVFVGPKRENANASETRSRRWEVTSGRGQMDAETKEEDDVKFQRANVVVAFRRVVVAFRRLAVVVARFAPNGHYACHTLFSSTKKPW